MSELYTLGFKVLKRLHLLDSMSDASYLKMAFKAYLGEKLNLDDPKTFNEKLQWLKLNDRKDIYTTMVDKYAVKNFVKEIIGEEYIIPTLGVWSSFDEIDFSALPEQFVMKCTHDSAGIVICKDKEQIDWKKAKIKISKALKRNFYLSGREWPYKNVTPRIIVEKYMVDNRTNELRNYKFFTFDGRVKALFVATGRQSPTGATFDFFDENYNHLPITNGHKMAEVIPEKPINFELMKQLAEKLAHGTKHLRVDFYEINGKVYFGELTFYQNSGLVPFEPKEWDRIFGSWLKLGH